MRKIEVRASEKYEVLIGSGALNGAGAKIKALAPRAETAAVIYDSAVACHLGRVEHELEAAGLRIAAMEIKSGEESKNGMSFLGILSFLAENRLTRSDILVSLGGGMVGDLSGFAAASFMRGIKYVQMPTTLLSAVDSSVGGKTAIDLPEGKNLAGAFCQPMIVVCDTDMLKTLPQDYFRDGCAEVIKYAVLGDETLFSHLERETLGFDREKVIARCVEMKSEYVSEDEFDTGVRRMLNLGHTLGHAVEAESGFELSHGKSVAIGLATVSRASAAEGLCSADTAERICALIRAFGLPDRTEKSIDELMPAMKSDKKHVGSSINVIIPREIGLCSVKSMTDAELAGFMRKGL